MKAGLIETLNREHTVLWLNLTDAGWEWAGANLTKALPASFVVMHHMMVRVGEHLARSGETPPRTHRQPAEAGQDGRGAVGLVARSARYTSA